MRDPLFAAKAVLVAGAALALAACGGATPANNVAGNEIEANASFEELGNDASAMETVTNTPETAVPLDNAADDAADDAGAEPGGNNVESNTLGM